MGRLLGRVAREARGQDLIEYGMLLLLIAVATVAAINALAPVISQLYQGVQTTISGS